MELREPIEDINKKLIDYFGRHEDGRPNFRVVYSDDQFEVRMSDYTDDGFQLLRPEARKFPKYRQWVPNRYILERLIPVMGETDLLEKTSYEPAWVFQDRNRNYLPPYFDGCKFVIENLLAAVNGSQKHYTKYKDDSLTPEAQAAELQRMMDNLFGNETPAGDALAYGTGVSLANTSKETVN